MSGKHPRFLLLRGGAIGDFILTLPALSLMRQRWPDAEMNLIGYPHIAELAHKAGLVDRIHSLDKAGIAQFFARHPVFNDETVAFIRSFDLVITWLHDRDDTVRKNLMLAGARQVIYGSPIVDNGHAIDHLMKPLEALALYEHRACARLNWPLEQTQWGRDQLRAMGVGERALAIHPGSGSPKKNWPADRFLAVIERVRADGRYRPYVLLGEADEALRDRFAHVPVWFSTSLTETASVLSASQAYIGNDSGITHLAAALGIPVTALFGPTDPEIWAPRGAHVRIVYGEDSALENVEVEHVWAGLGGNGEAGKEGKEKQVF